MCSPSTSDQAGNSQVQGQPALGSWSIWLRDSCLKKWHSPLDGKYQQAWVLLSFPPWRFLQNSFFSASHIRKEFKRKEQGDGVFSVSQVTSYPRLIKAFPLPALEVLKEVQTPLPASEVGASQMLAPDQVSLAMVHLQEFCYWFQPHLLHSCWLLLFKNGVVHVGLFLAHISLFPTYFQWMKRLVSASVFFFSYKGRKLNILFWLQRNCKVSGIH